MEEQTRPAPTNQTKLTTRNTSFSLTKSLYDMAKNLNASDDDLDTLMFRLDDVNDIFDTLTADAQVTVKKSIDKERREKKEKPPKKTNPKK